MYRITEFISDYPPEDQDNWGWTGSLDDAISLARMTFDLSPNKNNKLYYIIIMEENEDDAVEYLIHGGVEHRGDVATRVANYLANSTDIQDA